ncbi:MAG: nitroreductase [Mariprofundus sp.]
MEQPTMRVGDALRMRKSTRAFLNRPVAPELIEQLLSDASHAPSGANCQPWQVAVVSGETKSSLQQQMGAAFKRGERGKMDYQYYPLQWLPPYKTRQHECGLQLYHALHIERSDKQRRLEQWAANYRAFDAPVCLFFFLDASMEAGAWLDCGMFLQSLMLAAVEAGLASCAQAALAEYPAIVKSTLGYPDDAILLCGMALGYEDSAATVNSYRTPRADVHTFTHFYQ